MHAAKFFNHFLLFQTVKRSVVGVEKNQKVRQNIYLNDVRLSVSGSLKLCKGDERREEWLPNWLRSK
jgi:hypothetical protein